MVGGKYVPGQRYKWIHFEEVGAEDLPEISFKVRTSLMNAEYEAILEVVQDETPIEEAWEVFAPWVVEWNVGDFDEKGKLVDVPPPAVGGAEMFDKIPRPLFIRLAREMQQMVVKKVDPKSLNSPANTGEQVRENA